MPVVSRRGPFVRAGVAALVAFGLWGLTAGVRSMPPVYPLGTQPVYGTGDPAALVAIEPVLHAPWLGAAGPLAAAAAFLVLLGAGGVAVFAGATTMSALCVLAALALDVSFSAALAHAAGPALAVGLVWLAAGAAFDDHTRFFTRPIGFNPLAATVLWALAVWWDWIAVVTWPVVWAGFRRRPDQPGQGPWIVGSLVLGAFAFVAHFVWISDIANAITLALAPPVTWRDAIEVAFDARPRMPLGSFAAPELTTRLGYVLMALSAVGLAFGALGRWWRRTVCLSAALALTVGLVWSEWQAEVFRFSTWALAPLSAVGLSWVAAQGRRPLVITAILGAVALTETIASGSRPADGLDARGFRDAFSDVLDHRAGAGSLLLVAEDTRIDSALVPWMAARAPHVLRAPQDRMAVARALEDGRHVLAGAVGRRHLELAGVTFLDGFTVHEPTPFRLSEVESALRCATVRGDRWSELPGVEYTGRLGIELPGRLGGELQLVVGDALELPLRASTAEGRPVPLTMEPLLSGPGAAAPPPEYWMDGSLPEDAPPWMRRVHIAADPLRTSMVSLDLGRRAPRIIARLHGYDGDVRGRICAAPPGPTRLRRPGAERLPLGDESLFGTGWYGLEGGGTGGFRWADADAVVLVRSAVRSDVDVTLRAAPAAPPAAGADTTVTLRVNGIEVGERALAEPGAAYTWRVPAGAWLAGTNELWWHTSRAVRPADAGGEDTRSLALRVEGISVAR